MKYHVAIKNNKAQIHALIWKKKIYYQIKTSYKGML